MAESADALDSGSSRGNSVEVQVLLSAPKRNGNFRKEIAVSFWFFSLLTFLFSLFSKKIAVSGEEIKEKSEEIVFPFLSPIHCSYNSPAGNALSRIPCGL